VPRRIGENPLLFSAKIRAPFSIGGNPLQFSATIVLAACTASLPAQSRDPRAVQPERPTVATHAGTVAPGWLEIEAGVESDRFANGSHATGTPTVLKIGLGGRVQLNLAGTWTRTAAGGTSSSGIGDASAGLKWRVAEGARLLGDVAILPAVKFPTGSASSGSGTGTTDISLLLISSHDAGPVAVDLNAGWLRRSGDGSAAPRNATIWTASFGFPVRGTVGWVAEAYGYPGTSGASGAPPIVAVLTGPTLLVRPWLALDAGAILRVAGNQPRAAYAGGVVNTGRVWGPRITRKQADTRRIVSCRSKGGCPTR
jgi:hypothetical protein